MQLTLGRRADYTVRAVLHLARHHGEGLRKTRQIADDVDVSANYLPQLLAELARAGIVTSTPGPTGGYALGRDPADITLLEVIEVAEGELRSRECVLRGGPCRWEDACAVHEPWARAQEAMRESLAATTFASIAAIDAAMEAGTYEGPVRQR
jgi:Rrf2 family protein